MQKKQEKKHKETKRKNQHFDVNSKVIFGNHKLCAQFLNDYVDVPCLKNIQPEDIEDVKERYHFFDDVELNSDTVKRIRIKPKTEGKTPEKSSDNQDCLYLVSLIDHKSQVDYNVSMQLLRYMVCIWYNWEKEMSKVGYQKRKGYRYPPILPIVYYEGKGRWSAGYHLKDRVFLSDLFKEYIPDFRYQVIRIEDYDNRELLQKKDEISLLMLINKIRNMEDIREFRDISSQELNAIIENADEDVINIITAVVQSVCRKFNLPDNETAEFVGKVKDRNMGYLFENMKKMDIQAERRKVEEERAKADEARARADKTERSFIETLQELGQSKEFVTLKIIEKWDLDGKDAQEIVNRYWK